MTITERVSGANGTFVSKGVVEPERVTDYTPVVHVIVEWAEQGELTENDIDKIWRHISGISNLKYIEGGFILSVEVRQKSKTGAKLALAGLRTGLMLDALHASRKSPALGHTVEVRGRWDQGYNNRPSFHR